MKNNLKIGNTWKALRKSRITFASAVYGVGWVEQFEVSLIRVLCELSNLGSIPINDANMCSLFLIARNVFPSVILLFQVCCLKFFLEYIKLSASILKTTFILKISSVLFKFFLTYINLSASILKTTFILQISSVWFKFFSKIHQTFR